MKSGRIALLVATVQIGGFIARGGDLEIFAWGVNGHPFSQEGYWQVPITNQLDLIAESEARWYRVDLSHEAFLGNTARMDDLLTEAEKRRIHLLPVLSARPDARDKNATAAQIRAAAFEFGRQVAARYKGRITHWELQNELDDFAMIRKGEKMRNGRIWEWGDAEGGDPDTFNEERYRKAKAEIIGLLEGVKSADSNAVTMVDTAGWLYYGFIERLVNEDHVPFDVLAWHWYSDHGDITNVMGKINLMDRLKRFGKPIWITECNRRDGSKHGKEQEQAEYLARTAAQFHAMSAVSAFFAYELLDEPYFGVDGESDYGLARLKKNNAGNWQVDRKKSAFETFKSVISRSPTSTNANSK